MAWGALKGCAGRAEVPSFAVLNVLSHLTEAASYSGALVHAGNMLLKYTFFTTRC